MKGAGLPCRNGYDMLGIEKKKKKKTLSKGIRVSIKDGAGMGHVFLEPCQ